MNILFVNYGSSQSNSMNHIAIYANELCKNGHSCTVAVYSEANLSNPTGHEYLFSLLTYDEILDKKELPFPNSQKADIIHAWTPRENVRKFVELYRTHFGDSKLIVHLEDNEDSILENYYQTSIYDLRYPAPGAQSPDWNQQLSHPLEYRRLLTICDAITTLVPSLEKLAPFPKPTLNIRPPITPPNQSSEKYRSKIESILKHHQGHKVIAYTGGITSNNREDLRALYLAVKLLNENNHKTVLIKTGPSCSDFEKSFEFPLSEIQIDLGFVDKDIVFSILKSADVLVQPGLDNSFNRDRFPCKIPEFLASGTPTIIPKFYEALVPEKANSCLYLHKSSPTEIAEKCLFIFTNPDLSQEMGENAKNFLLKEHSPLKTSTSLESFYKSILEQDRPAHREDPNFNFRDKFLAARKQLKSTELDNVSLNQSIRTLHAEKSDLTKELEQLEARAIESEARLQRLKSTFSWRSTVPLRFLRRNLLDPVKKNNRPNPPMQERELAPEGKIARTSTRPPEGHPCHHKNYYDFTKRESEKIKIYISDFKCRLDKIPLRPEISILLPVYNVDETWLRKCIDSVINQIYPNWELCICDDASTEPHIKDVIMEYGKRHSNIKTHFRKNNGHISQASNAAFELSNGQYIALLDHDDEIPPHALAKVVDAINDNPDVRILYTDEDKIDDRGIRHDPHFKSDWNYDLLLGCNMISHFGVYERQSFEAVGGFRAGYEGAQDWDLALRICESTAPKDIVHIPDVLYHWRAIPGSTSIEVGQKEYAYIAQRKAITSHLDRIGAKASLQSLGGVNWRVKYDLPSPIPKVSIIIPTKDRIDLLRPCIESILIKTCYENYEIHIIDNNSVKTETLLFLKQVSEDPRVRVFSDSSPFNYSRLNNKAILRTDADLICLLNNDTEVIDGSWLTEMARHAARPEIGAVGAKLLYPHNHVQHCGVIMGIYDIAGHAFKLLHRDDDGHKGRAKLVSAYSAVTGACMLFKRTHWEQAGGLNEKDLPISYNDIDFCLKLGELGFSNIVTPFAELYHKESESRGNAELDTEVLRFEAESEYMRETWSHAINRDPYYNRNFTLTKEDFSYLE